MRVRKEVDFTDPLLRYLLGTPRTTKYEVDAGVNIDDDSTIQRRKFRPPEEGWFFPKDFYEKERFPNSKPLMTVSKVPRVRDKYGPKGYDILESKETPKEKGEGRKIAVRLKPDKKTFLRLWLQAIRQGVGKEFMNSPYYLRSPHGFKLSLQFAEDMGFLSLPEPTPTAAGVPLPENYRDSFIYSVPMLFLQYHEASKAAISSFKNALVGDGKAFNSVSEYAMFLRAMASYLEFASCLTDTRRKRDFESQYHMLCASSYTKLLFKQKQLEVNQAKKR